MTELTKEDYLKKYIKGETLPIRLLSVLKIAQWDVKGKTGRYYTTRRANPYNPLTYIYLLIMVFVGSFVVGFPEIRRELKTIFKWD